MASISEFLLRRPAIAFVAFLGLHFLVWTLLPAAIYPNLRLDLIEALTYGREWQLGYDKLPPLPWWMVEIVWRIFRADIALYALAQLAIILSFAFVWVLARKLVGPVLALIAVLCLDGLHYFHEASTQFNHNVVGLPFWALTGLAFHAALRDSRNRNWALVGFALGAGFWSKYFVVVLALPCALFLLVDRDARRSLGTAGPWIACATGLAVAAPHLIWLLQHEFVPIGYADSQSDPRRGWFDHLFHPLKFAVVQFGFLLPSLAIVAPLFWSAREEPARSAPVEIPDAFDRRIVAWLTFGPLLTVMAMSLFSGRGAQPMWGFPIWLFLGIWIVMQWPRPVTRKTVAWVVTIWAVVFSAFVLAVVVDNSGVRFSSHGYRASLFPGKPLADELSRKFQDATGRELTYVIGPAWEGGNVSHYAATNPRLLIDGDPARAPWIDLEDLKTKGAIVLWSEHEDKTILPEEYKRVATGAEVGVPLILKLYRNGMDYPIGWAILRPAGQRR